MVDEYDEHYENSVSSRGRAKCDLLRYDIQVDYIETIQETTQRGQQGEWRFDTSVQRGRQGTTVELLTEAQLSTRSSTTKVETETFESKA